MTTMAKRCQHLLAPRLMFAVASDRFLLVVKNQKIARMAIA
jgi:hypothetical protein